MSWMGIMRSHINKFSQAKFSQAKFSQALLLVLISMAAPTAAQASVTDTQVNNLVEALRDVAKQSTSKPKTLHSDWRISERNIGPWSKQCLQTEMTIEMFDKDPATVAKVVTCKVKEVLVTEYEAADSDEALALRRFASWWRTGDANTYSTPETAAYADRILKAYQRRNESRPFATKPSDNNAKPGTVTSLPPVAVQPVEPVESKPVESKPVELEVKPLEKPVAKAPGAKPVEVRPGSTKKQTGPIVSVNAGRITAYDRYMIAAKKAEEQKDVKKALLFFRRAIDERPEDPAATAAIQALESK
jgi:hypothetical protein